MFNSPVLDLVILLTFIYFMGSLILSAINESLAGALRLRPKQLQQSLEDLFFGTGWSTFVSGTLMQSPHIQSLMKDNKSYPSYIPAQNFVLAVIQQLGSGFTPAGLQNAISTNTNIPQDFKQVLGDLALQTQNDLDKFQQKLEEFYNNAMDRAGGVYKKKSRLILLVLGFVIALFMNLDTIRISRDALSNKQQLGKTVDNIVSKMPAISEDKGQITIKTSDGSIAASQSDKLDTSKNKEPLKDKIQKINDLNDYLQTNSGISLGYKCWDDFTKKWNPFNGDPGDFLLALLGVLITTFAMQMSSSFWFDLMNKVANVRAAGKKPKADSK
jgi:hypothetical protein